MIKTDRYSTVTSIIFISWIILKIITTYLFLDFLRNVRMTNIFEGIRFLPGTTPLTIKIAQSAQH